MDICHVLPMMEDREHEPHPSAVHECGLPYGHDGDHRCKLDAVKYPTPPRFRLLALNNNGQIMFHTRYTDDEDIARDTLLLWLSSWLVDVVKCERTQDRNMSTMYRRGIIHLPLKDDE